MMALYPSSLPTHAVSPRRTPAERPLEQRRTSGGRAPNRTSCRPEEKENCVSQQCITDSCEGRLEHFQRQERLMKKKQ
jgi:hypothetical protein